MMPTGSAAMQGHGDGPRARAMDEDQGMDEGHGDGPRA